MPVLSIAKISETSTTRISLLLALTLAGPANHVSAQDTEQAPTETIEEIVVYGDKSLNTLKQAVFRAEEVFFDLFRLLNDDEEYDIRCFYETPTGTHIKKHVCRANFVTAATSAAAETFKTRGPRIPTVPAETVIMQKGKRL